MVTVGKAERSGGRSLETFQFFVLSLIVSKWSFKKKFLIKHWMVVYIATCNLVMKLCDLNN